MPSISYDTETTGLNPHQGARMFAYSTCTFDGKTDVKRLDGSNLRKIKSKKALVKLWDDTRITKIMHNAKFDLHMTERALGYKLDKNKIHCTHKMSHIVRNDYPRHSLDQLAWDLAECEQTDNKIKKMAQEVGGYKNIPEHHMDKYQRSDAFRTMLLYRFFWPKIKSNPKWLDCYNTEIDLIWTTMRLENRGLMINIPHTTKLIDRLSEDNDNSRNEMFKLAGYRFNPNSDLQLRKLLFTHLNLPVLKLTKKSKAPSTDKEVLEKLFEISKLPIINLIRKHTSYAHGISILKSYIELSDDEAILRPTINTCAAITSRESSSDPNLQNVQKTGVLLSPFPVPAREAFRPRPGYINVHVDYSGIEMRLLIHYSKDPKMLDCLNNGDGDVHALAANVFYGKLFTDLAKKNPKRKTYRDATKNCNFAIPYGAGWMQAAKTLGMKPKEGKKAFERYEKEFPDLCHLNSIIMDEVLQSGYVETTFGRRLYVSKNKAYMGANYKIQGTAAGVLKRAQNRVHRYNEEYASDIRILLPIHDEIVIEYPRKQLPHLKDYLRAIHSLMTDFSIFEVQMDVEADITTASWARKKEIKFGGSDAA